MKIFKNLYKVKDKYIPNITLDELENRNKNNWNWHRPQNPFITPIICQHCHKNSGYTEEGFRHYVIFCDIKCKNCGEVIIEYNGGIWC